MIEFHDCIDEFCISIEKLINMTMESIKEFSIEAIEYSWKNRMSSFLKSRSGIQSRKKILLSSLVTGLGHPKEKDQLQTLENSVAEACADMMTLLEETKNTCIYDFEKISTDFIGRILFTSCLVNDIICNLLCINGILYKVILGTNLVKQKLANLDFASIPFDSIKTKFQGIYLYLLFLDLEITCSGSHPAHHTLTFVRNQALGAYSDKLRNLLTVLDQNLASEFESEEKWKQGWNHQVGRIKNAF
jgi:hypothetical protein